jgi:AcrR family transcriptional regulator
MTTRMPRPSPEERRAAAERRLSAAQRRVEGAERRSVQAERRTAKAAQRKRARGSAAEEPELRVVSTRAAPMSPEERRASIVAAAMPLVRIHGKDVTTRQIAEAAGVAEGTLFRVFDDKEAIVQAVVNSVLDSGPVVSRLDAIDAHRPIDELLPELVSTLQHRMRDVIEIMMAVRWMPPEHISRHRQDGWQNDPIMHRIIEMLSGHGDELSIAPEQAAKILRLLVFAGTHPMISDGRPLETDEIVSTLLDGIRRRPPAKFAQHIRRNRIGTTPSAKSSGRTAPTAKSP